MPPDPATPPQALLNAAQLPQVSTTPCDPHRPASPLSNSCLTSSLTLDKSSLTAIRDSPPKALLLIFIGY
ncbi:hypothetical protein L484_012780 [Morus notabilis]|uniref:Uncharacterized protein n=1 Tax=Morus notabilis TaxID=981085 RepID=W9SB34_9ROSA|nr:hypothetical protein L484_012780 [Morus notabilis]